MKTHSAFQTLGGHISCRFYLVTIGTADGKPCRGIVTPHLQEIALLFCLTTASCTNRD